MESGWSRFRALYDYIPGDDNEIAISANDILIVAKPVVDPKGWLLAHNEQTKQMGDVPGTYLEKIDDVDEFVLPDEAPPPIPPRPSAKSGHKSVKLHCTRPVFCHCCEDFIWGNDKEYYKCQACEVTCHLQCAVSLPSFPCVKREDSTEEDPYEHLVASIEEWTVEDVLSWLAVTNYYTYADVFREFQINSSKLQLLNKDSLMQMGIEEASHQHSLLYAIKELFTGSSTEKDSQMFSGFHRAPKGSQGDHVFRVQNFQSIHWCDKCGKCLWGLYQQGLQCSVCGLCSHQMCVNDGIPICPGRRVKASSDDNDGGAAAFGHELGAQFQPSHKPAPTVVIKCVDAIEQRGLKVEGIYRITPTGHEKVSLHAALNQNPGQVLMSDQEWRNPLCIAAVLKMYFQELPSCLFTEDKYDEFIQICKGIGNSSVDDLITLINDLPHPNRAVIHYLMEHLFKVSKHQQFNGMSSLELARVFAHILLRPKQQEKIKMSVNHDFQIQVLDVLISQGPWSVCEPMEDGPSDPPPVPQRPVRPPRINKPPPPEPTPVPSPPANSDLKDQVWYWGETSKETVQERMKETADGTFIVRDSKRNPGEYTLTLRKGGSSKLIRIIYQNGKYGFSEPLTFVSIVDLVDYYREQSLVQYNAKLDVRLTEPLPLYDQETESESETLEHLEKLYHDLESKSNDYEQLQKMYEELMKTTKELQLVKDAQHSIISVIEEQMGIHETFQKVAPPQSRAVLRENFELLKQRLNDAQFELLESERELSNTSEKSRQTDQLMNTLRAQIIELQTKKQTYIDILVNEKGYTQDEAKEIVNEGIRQGCIYQVPDTDLSEANWKFGMIHRDEAAALLKDCPDGTFLIRDSINHRGSYSVTLSFDFEPRHIHIIKGLRGYGFNPDYAIYPTLKDLVEHYHNNTLQKHNRHLATKLVYPIRFFKKNI